MSFELTNEQFLLIKDELIADVKGCIKEVVYEIIDNEVDVRDVVYEIISDKLTDCVESDVVIDELLIKLNIEDIKNNVTNGIIDRFSWNKVNLSNI